MLNMVCVYVIVLVCELCSLVQGLLTLEEMKEKQETLVKAREQQISAKLASKTPR